VTTVARPAPPLQSWAYVAVPTGTQPFTAPAPCCGADVEWSSHRVQARTLSTPGRCGCGGTEAS
jgi:hypothetical protein